MVVTLPVRPREDDVSGPSIFTLIDLPRRPGASIENIEAAERDLGVRLPEDYRSFLKESDGLEGFAGPEGDYVMLWGAGEIAKLNAGYCVAEFAPGVVLVGSNGGGEAFGYVRREGRKGYIRLPFIPMNLKEADDMGGTLFDLIVKLKGN